jgi:hypothetical protein
LMNFLAEQGAACCRAGNIVWNLKMLFRVY